jgi:hypothetical protein
MACSVSTGSDREICNKTPKIPEPEPSLDQQLCTNRRCDEERALLAKWDMNRVAEDGLCVVCGGPERRLSALGTPEDEHLPVLSIVAAVGLEPEPPEKGPGTAKGGHEGTRPLASGGHDPGKWWITNWAAHFLLRFQI